MHHSSILQCRIWVLLNKFLGWELQEAIIFWCLIRRIYEYNMKDSKIIHTPLSNHFKLSKGQSLKIEKEWTHVENVSFALPIDSFINAMVSIRLDITQVVRVISSYMS